MRTMAEILDDMEYCEKNGDTEVAHSAADDLLVEAIRLLTSHIDLEVASEELIASYYRVDKWYA